MTERPDSKDFQQNWTDVSEQARRIEELKQEVASWKSQVLQMEQETIILTQERDTEVKRARIAENEVMRLNSELTMTTSNRERMMQLKWKGAEKELGTAKESAAHFEMELFSVRKELEAVKELLKEKESFWKTECAKQMTEANRAKNELEAAREENERLQMELNAETNGEYSKQAIELEKLREYILRLKSEMTQAQIIHAEGQAPDYPKHDGLDYLREAKRKDEPKEAP